MEVHGNIESLRTYMLEASRQGLAAAAAYLVQRAQQAVSVQNPSRAVTKLQKRTASGRRATRTIFSAGSPPGTPPYRRTGVGMRSIGLEMAGDANTPAVRVGVAGMGIHMMYHELGINPGHAGGRHHAEAVKRRVAKGLRVTGKQKAYQPKVSVAVARPWLLPVVDANWETMQRICASMMSAP